ncbi:MAG: 1,4-alpha-glucan branching protein GlgB [Deltaproteobacteria bacterium]|nr:1,4-alpha-glucan branching protein GlgB [Deltaproteobacteria bacterium]
MGPFETMHTSELILQSPISKAEYEALVSGDHSQPHTVLGVHPVQVDGVQGVVVRAYHPDARSVDCLCADGRSLPLHPIVDGGLFQLFVKGATLPFRYRLRFSFPDDATCELIDPYCFPPTIGKQDLHFFGEGNHLQLWKVLGAHPRVVEETEGVSFAVWAPNARRVSVVGDFCRWDGRRFPMRVLGSSGVFELFIPGLGVGELYKYEIKTQEGHLRLKADPFAFCAEVAPGTASRIALSSYSWDDQEWVKTRSLHDIRRQAVAIYEVHLGSWARVPEQEARVLGYREIAPRLIGHMKRFGFTHLQLMPVAEYPYTASWGYQITSYFAPTGRYGAPDDFRYLVDQCHQNGIGVILDWVPAHFPRDDFALRRFDGTPLYEHEDSRLGEHPDWGTLIFNYGRIEVRNFLIANALYWLDEFHIDGLRVDAVASMLYRDYSRKQGEWLPNQYGGNENLEAVDLFRSLNEIVRLQRPGCFVVAEESTAWNGVTRSVAEGGLGFTFKWNMGWMHDTLKYFARDPIYRKYHQNDLTFSMLYEYTEKFIMPLSHDEVVHGKRSLLEKMPGDLWHRFANLRLLLAYQYTRPGKKLVFMGTEIAPYSEWYSEVSLDWHLAEEESRIGLACFIEDLARIYLERSCLWRKDHEPEGYQWIDHQDHDNTVLSYLRRDGSAHLVVVLNFAPVYHHHYRVGVPEAGAYRELLCSDNLRYFGSGSETPLYLETEPVGQHGFAQSIGLKLPPLGALILEPINKGVPFRRKETREDEQPVSSGSHVSGRPSLHKLSARCGILSSYQGTDGQKRYTSDSSRELLLQAMGFDASTEENAARALERLNEAEQRRLVDAVRVIGQGSAELGMLNLRIPSRFDEAMEWNIELKQENGPVLKFAGELDGKDPQPIIRLADALDLPAGYHEITCHIRCHRDECRETQQLIVTPTSCLTAQEVLGERRAFGLWTHLYTINSNTNWGFGDLSDLRALIRWAGNIKAEFVGINPLHALGNTGGAISPYYPISRLFYNLLYLDISVIPELKHCKEVARTIASSEFQARIKKLREARSIDYEEVLRAKRPLLQALHRSFIERHRRKQTARGLSYEKFVNERGESLRDFATFCLLKQRFELDSPRCGDWRNWPAPYRDPKSPEVEAFRQSHQDEVDFYTYLQFEIEQQLQAVNREATKHGLAIGVYHDLAVGSAPGGSDTWSFAHLFAQGANIGAPPDEFSRQGQDWGLAPLSPQALKEDGFRFWILLLRNALRHGGALRIDHVMGLVRQYWVPSGRSAVEGAYVRYPTADLFGILALESRRNRALIIGEDLGTVPFGFREALAKWSVLGSQVLYFERDAKGAFRPASEYSSAVLVTANTHDLATLPGLWEGKDLEVRREVGHIPDDEQLKAELVERENLREELLKQLTKHGIISEGWSPSSIADLCRVLYTFLSRTPSPLLGLSLDDLGGELDSVNLPGVSNERRKNWTRRLRLSLEEFFVDPSVQLILESIRDRVKS